MCQERLVVMKPLFVCAITASGRRRGKEKEAAEELGRRQRWRGTKRRSSNWSHSKCSKDLFNVGLELIKSPTASSCLTDDQASSL